MFTPSNYMRSLCNFMGYKILKCLLIYEPKHSYSVALLCHYMIPRFKIFQMRLGELIRV